MDLKTEFVDIRHLPGDFVRVTITLAKVEKAQAVRLHHKLLSYGLSGKNVLLDVTGVDEVHEDAAAALQTFAMLAAQPANPGEKGHKVMLLIRDEEVSRYWQKTLPGLVQRPQKQRFERVA